MVLIGRFIVIVAVMLCASIAVAESSVGLVFRDGSGAVRKSVVAAAAEIFNLAPNATSAELRRAWGSQSVARFGARSVSDVPLVLDVAGASGVDVIIAVEVEQRGRRRRPKQVFFTAIRSSDGLWLGNESIPLRSRGRGRRRTLAIANKSSLKEYFEAVALKMTSEPDSSNKMLANPEQANISPSHSSTDAGLSKTIRRSPSELDRPVWSRANRLVGVEGYGLLHGRRFEYFDTLTRNLQEFDSGISYGAGLRAEFFPVSFKRASGTTRRIGLIGGFAQDFGISPSVASAPEIDLSHSWSEWFVGAAVAWDFESVLLRATTSYGNYGATFSAPPEFESADELPSVEYEYLSLGIAGRYEAEWLSLFADTAYDFIRSSGDVGERLFPNAAVGGLRVRGGAARHMFDTAEVFIAFQYDHFFYDMRPQRGDEFLAGGALDVQGTVELGVSYAY